MNLIYGDIRNSARRCHHVKQRAKYTQGPKGFQYIEGDRRVDGPRGGGIGGRLWGYHDLGASQLSFLKKAEISLIGSLAKRRVGRMKASAFNLPILNLQSIR